MRVWLGLMLVGCSTAPVIKRVPGDLASPPQDARIAARPLGGNGARTAVDSPFHVGDRIQLEVWVTTPTRIAVFETLAPGLARRIVQADLTAGRHILPAALTFTNDPAPTPLLVVLGPKVPSTAAGYRAAQDRARPLGAGHGRRLLVRAIPPNPVRRIAAGVGPHGEDGGEVEAEAAPESEDGPEDRPQAVVVGLRTAPVDDDGPWRTLSPITRFELRSDAAGRPNPAGDPCTRCRVVLRAATGIADLVVALADEEAGVEFIEPRIELRGRDAAVCATAALDESLWPGQTLTLAGITLEGCPIDLVPAGAVVVTRIGANGTRSAAVGHATVRVSDW